MNTEMNRKIVYKREEQEQEVWKADNKHVGRKYTGERTLREEEKRKGIDARGTIGGAVSKEQRGREVYGVKEQRKEEGKSRK